MADASGSHLDIGAPVEKRGRSRPRGSKNKATTTTLVASSSAPMKRRPGRPVGSKNKPKPAPAAPGPSAPPANAPPLGFILFSVLPAHSAVRFSAYR
jgi:hypothetical protein